MKPLYEPKGKAKEYGDYAVNIYTGCPHKCYYCFAPSVLHKDRQQFHTDIRPRDGIVEALRQQIEREDISGKLIHLCFTCDPYPTGYDSSTTREIIKVIKETGNNVQILTKGDGSRDFDLLDGNDWYGITYDGTAGGAYPSSERWERLIDAKELGIRTWVSFEPVVDAENVLLAIKTLHRYIDKMKIGKLNYHKSDIDWGKFGKDVEALCTSVFANFYIKESLRAEMEAIK